MEIIGDLTPVNNSEEIDPCLSTGRIQYARREIPEDF